MIKIYRGCEILENIESGSLELEKFKQYRDLKNDNILNYCEGKLEIQEKNGRCRNAFCSDLIHREFEELTGVPIAYPISIEE